MKMTDSSSQPNLAEDFLRIHRAITRGLTVGVNRGSEFIRDGFPDINLQKGFVLYLQALTAVLSAHHLGEDEVAFPALKQIFPAVPYGSLATEHVKIEAGLDLVKSALPELASDKPSAALTKVVESLQQILSIWAPHIQQEQISFSSTAIASAMSVEQQSELSASLAKHGQEHAGPPFFALPFVLFNLSPEDRERMAAVMPKLVIEELIPGEWKDKWAPMKPFLLD
jgi:hypothetical protein